MNEFAPDIHSLIDHVLDSIKGFRPEIILVIAFLLVIFFSLFVDKKWRFASFFIILVGIVVATIQLYCQEVDDATGHFFGMLRTDSFSRYGRAIILCSTLIVTIYIQQYCAAKAIRKKPGDIYAVLLATTIGLHLLTMTSHWLMAFIAIEMVSIGSYVMVGYFSENKRQSEAAMKYVLFGSVCAAVMLYGLSLLFGFTGTLEFDSIEAMKGLISAPQIMTTVAILFVFVGIGFKLGFVPLHVWTPDVYEGAPTPITAFLSTVPKIGAIVLFGRLVDAWGTSSFYYGELTLGFLFFVAIVTMLIGNLVALRQQNIKRLMAYSSIGHTGFLLMALISYMQGQQEILLFYMVVYTIMNLGVFGAVMVLEFKLGSTQIESYMGLGKYMPWIFGSLTVLGISLVGLPPTAGFIGKLLVLTSVFDIYQSEADVIYLILLIVGVLTSVISLFYYLRIPLNAFLRKETQPYVDQTNRRYPILVVMVVLLTVSVIAFGLFPTIILRLFQ